MKWLFDASLHCLPLSLSSLVSMGVCAAHMGVSAFAVSFGSYQHTLITLCGAVCCRD